MRNKIFDLLISIIVCLALLFSFIFLSKISCNKIMTIYSTVDKTTMIINKKINNFINQNKLVNNFFLKDLYEDKWHKCYLNFKQQVDNNNYMYYCEFTEGEYMELGTYQIIFDFGDIYFYQYLMYFS